MGTSAYSPLNGFELGIDVFTTYERLQLTQRPGLNVVTFGSMVGLRFQRRLEWGPEGFIPFAGLLIGPTFAGAYNAGGSWFCVGLTCILPKVPDRPLSRNF